MERKYYSINEDLARAANDANSFSEYREGKATDQYTYYVDKVYDIVGQIEKAKPQLFDKALRMADRYSQRIAVYFNDYNRNEAYCPSVLISGGSNFPTKKKEKQNSRRDSLIEEWKNIEGLADKISNLLYHEQPILSGDENAIALLEEKLKNLQEDQDMMKNTNAYYRSNGTLDGCPFLTVQQIEKIKADTDFMSKYDGHDDRIFRSWQLSNNAANIRRTKQRIETLKKEKDAGNTEIENEFFKVVENKEIMRLQLFFDGKPQQEVRDILKKNGFRWAPSVEAWQRQLTDNARYAAKQVLKQISEIS